MRDDNHPEQWSTTDWADHHTEGFIRQIADDDAEAFGLEDSLPIWMRDEARRLIHAQNEPPGDYDEQAAHRTFVETVAAGDAEPPLRNEARALLLAYGPWHLVSQVTGKHMGPFSTELDCHMARAIAASDWKTAVAMDRDTFDRHLDA